MRYVIFEVDEGWTTNVQDKRGCIKLTVRKGVAQGLCLRSPQRITGYKGKLLGIDSRPAILYLADGKELDGYSDEKSIDDLAKP